MQLHHAKHHQTYITNLNVAEEKFSAAAQKNDLTAQIALQGAIKFNGGGHINHRFIYLIQHFLGKLDIGKERRWAIGKGCFIGRDQSRFWLLG